MSQLEPIIRDLIEAEGPISLARYMQLALQHPQYGYYVSGDPLGEAGDFTTSPEISQMFGEMVGLWCAEVWRLMGCPSRFALLEMGPGRGTLMQDALRATQKVEGFHEAMQLHLLESNATLKEAQAKRLGDFSPRFIGDLSFLPPLPLIAVANEFFDAMPVHQYIKTLQGWRERLVGIEGGKFVFVHGGEPVPLPLPDGLSFYEISPQAVGFAQDVARAVAQHGGGALIVDYGYAQPAGHDTLQAVLRHAAAPVLESPGEIDITAHVDFAALRLAAEKQGAKASRIVTQGEFLRAMGIELRAAQLKRSASDIQAQDIDSGLRRLTDSSQMGVLFKALAFVSKNLHEMPGFS